jgi:hypothetical protein
MPLADELLPQLEIIINFPVINNTIPATLVPHRLPGGNGQIYDTQPPVAEADVSFPEKTLVIRTPMAEGLDHNLKIPILNLPLAVYVVDSTNSTHGLSPEKSFLRPR